MKKSISTSIFLLTLIFGIKAQEINKNFGKISISDFEITNISFKTADAVVLFDMGRSYFERGEEGFDVVFERKTRIKIQNEAGKRWAEIEIPYYQEGNIYEKIYEIEAYTYTLEEGIIKTKKFDLSESFDEKINNSWKLKKFILPNVNQDCIIEYKYKISSQYLFNLRDWEFQWRIPVLYSEYIVKMIPFYEYSSILQNANKFDEFNSYVDSGLKRQFGSILFNDMVYKYVMKNIPPFNDEEFITSINDYIIKLDFQLSKITYTNGATKNILTTWEELIKDLLKNDDFGKYIKKAEKQSKDLFINYDLLHKSDTEKFDFVINYVKKNFNWNKINSKYASKNTSKFIEEKFGNSADINLFTIGLLNGLGVEAYPLLISTRNNGKILYNYPFLHFFNYVLIATKINGENVLTDATDILNLNTRIPEQCINDKGLIIKKDTVEWIYLTNNFPSELKTTINISINDNNIRSAINKDATEYSALYYRKKYSDNIDKIKESLESQNYNIIDSTIRVKNLYEKNEPYILSFSDESEVEIINDKLYISPFFYEIPTDNPFKQVTRSYPIDMKYPQKKTFVSEIQIPEGYRVHFLPKEYQLNNDLFELKYTIKNAENRILINFSYYFKQSVYSPKHYQLLKTYFNVIINKGQEKIVLIKDEKIQ